MICRRDFLKTAGIVAATFPLVGMIPKTPNATNSINSQIRDTITYYEKTLYNTSIRVLTTPDNDKYDNPWTFVKCRPTVYYNNTSKSEEFFNHIGEWHTDKDKNIRQAIVDTMSWYRNTTRLNNVYGGRAFVTVRCQSDKATIIINPIGFWYYHQEKECTIFNFRGDDSYRDHLGGKIPYLKDKKVRSFN